MYTFARCSGSRTRLCGQSFQTQKRLCLCPPTERQVFLYRVIFLPSAMRPRYSKYGGPPDPWFCFPWFQLPVGNCGLKILNGKMSEMNNSYVSSCPPASSAMPCEQCDDISRCLALSRVVLPETVSSVSALSLPTRGHSAAVWVIGATVTVSQCRVQLILAVLRNASFPSLHLIAQAFHHLTS